MNSTRRRQAVVIAIAIVVIPTRTVNIILVVVIPTIIVNIIIVVDKVVIAKESSQIVTVNNHRMLSLEGGGEGVVGATRPSTLREMHVVP